MNLETMTEEQVALIDNCSLTIEVPAHVELPEELTSPIPRTVPTEISAHRRIRIPFVVSGLLVATFLAAVIAGARPLGPPWSQIAFWSTTLLAIPGIIGLFTCRRELRYIQDGSVAAGEIVDLALVPAMDYNGQTIALKHVVTLKFPLSDGTSATSSFEGLQVQADSHRRTDWTLGDWLPIVWLPGRFRKTAMPYAFLKFNHEKALSRATEQERTVWKKVGTAVTVVAIFGVLIANLLLLMWCVPVRIDVPVIAVIGVLGALLLGGLMYAVIVREFRNEQRKAAERNQRAVSEGGAIEQGSTHAMLTNTWKGWFYRILIGTGCLLLGGMTLVLWTFGANQFFDRSPPVDRIIEITDVKQVGGKPTRTKITFHPVDEPLSEYSTDFTRRDMPNLPLFVGQKASVPWHPGAFGWPWIGEFQQAPQ